MSYTLMVVLSYSIVPAAFAGLLKLRDADEVFHPILAFIILGLVNELVSTLVIRNGHSNALNNNIFSFLQVLLILFQFRRWQLFDEHHFLFKCILIMLVMTWMVQNRSWNNLNLFLPFFRCVSSVIIVIMSIINIIKLTIMYNRHLLKSSEFLFCTAFCIYFSTAILVEVVFYYGAGTSVELQDAIFKSGSIVNVVTNIIYLIAILWMPMKPRFIMQ